MKEERKPYNEYWAEVQRYFGIHDKLTMTWGEDDWEGDEVIEFRNSCGCLLSRYSIDKEIARYY